DPFRRRSNDLAPDGIIFQGMRRPAPATRDGKGSGDPVASAAAVGQAVHSLERRLPAMPLGLRKPTPSSPASQEAPLVRDDGEKKPGSLAAVCLSADAG